jgi:hypothetical protein
MPEFIKGSENLELLKLERRLALSCIMTVKLARNKQVESETINVNHTKNTLTQLNSWVRRREIAVEITYLRYWEDSFFYHFRLDKLKTEK